MDDVKNPYRPGAGTPPPALIGRDDLIREFGVTIRRAMAGKPGKSLMPVGLRGVGKTVLLNRFCEIARNEKCRVAFIEAPETHEFRTMLAVELRKVLLPLKQTLLSKALNKALGALGAFTLTSPEGYSFKLDVSPLRGCADSGDLASDLTDLLVAIGEAVRDRKVGMLLALDEVQYLDGEELGALISAIHRTTQLELPVVLVGAGLPQLPGLAGNAKSYAERLFNFPNIGSLKGAEASDALAIPAKQNGVRINQDALDMMVSESQGYPYFLQQWGYHAWNHAPRTPITLADVESVKPAVTEQLDSNFFLVRLERLTPKEREYLRAMAELGPGPQRSGDIATALGVKVESVAPRRSTLITKGMIYSPAHGDTAFTVPLFDEFMKRQTSKTKGRTRTAKKTK